MSQPLIRTALETALKTWADANSMPVQWQNTVLSPQPATYLRAFLLPAETEAADLGRVNRRYSGIWQISICRPIGEGSGAAEAIVQALAAVYSPATPLIASGLKVWAAQPLSAGPAVLETAHYVTPCSLQYLADTY